MSKTELTIKKGLLLKSFKNEIRGEYFAKLKVKGHYLKRFTQEKTSLFTNPEKIHKGKVFPHHSLLKYLVSMRVRMIGDRKGPSLLKSLKNLIYFSLEPLVPSKEGVISLPILRNLPKSVKEVNIQLIDQYFDLEWPLSRQIFRKVSRLQRLTSFAFSYHFPDHIKRSESVYHEMKQYFKRSIRLKKMTYHQGISGFKDYQKTVSESHPYLTDLTLVLIDDLVGTPATFYKNLKCAGSDESGSDSESDHSENSNGSDNSNDYIFKKTGKGSSRRSDRQADRQAVKRCSRRYERKTRKKSHSVHQQAQSFSINKIKPLMNFTSFPNLKTLKLVLNLVVPLDDIWEGAVKSLENLESFSLQMELRPNGTSSFLQALNHFKHLKVFELGVPFLREREWTQLGKFVSSRPILKSFALILSQPRSSLAHFYAENAGIEELMTYLSHIQFLELQCPYTSIESISMGLSKLESDRKLRSLRIYASGVDEEDVDLTGLMEFIKVNRKTLCQLELSISYLFDLRSICFIFETVSKLQELNHLRLEFNEEYYEPVATYLGAAKMYFTRPNLTGQVHPRRVEEDRAMLRSILRGGEGEYKNYVLNTLQNMRTTQEFKDYQWEMNVNVMKYLEKLPRLEELTLAFGRLTDLKTFDDQKWFTELFKGLKNLRSLRAFEYKRPFAYFDSECLRMIKRHLDYSVANPFLSIQQITRDALLDLAAVRCYY